ncbi:cation-transporting P-type ATPase [Thiomicrorhabdus sp. zzn3]|uniref:cation-translocating P-type ATPase n=1 Tax=Thiomicrorhabdus sp. zzn3 TaxID=3039775 RepID=UPI002436D213|nr:cation-transporting P-type ATPase [Thiomicrorhabdus sp. zzn3]MDG6777542.1 cation-transporting P-type ATPase [Thiomicrorhabdus sp. zzn3]
MKWFQQSVERIAERLKTDMQTGLSSAQAAEKQTHFGANKLVQTQQASPFKILLNQLKNPLLVILSIGVLLSLYSQHISDAIAIGVIILINATISFVQEYRAQKSIDALRKMAAPQTTVMRDHQWQTLAAAELVPGDIVKLAHGATVPADVRLFESHQLQVDESALTGESEPVHKHCDAITEESTALCDQRNMAFMSTHVVHGHALAIVCDTGMHTEVGKIAHLMQTADTQLTPLQQRVHKLSKVLIAAALVVVTIVMATGLLGGMNTEDIVATGISLAVAAIPEGMMTILTIVLTLGAKQMMHNQGLVRQLASVETLGSTSVICTDKTGTLTQNKMQVTQFWVAGEYYHAEGSGYEAHGQIRDAEGQPVTAQSGLHLDHFFTISALCNDAQLIHHTDRTALHGLPTDGALLSLAEKSGLSLDNPNEDLKLIKRFPFDSKRKMMSVIMRDRKGDHWLFCKGAPDVVMHHSEALQLQNHLGDLPSDNQIIADVVEQFAHQALRTLAIAYRKLQPDEIHQPHDELENNLIFIGIHGIMDPPRPEATQAIAECHSAGIRVIMITGDHAATALAIAKQMNIVDETLDSQTQSEVILTGHDLNTLSDEELRQKVHHIHVFARVTPEHKLRIVQALQANGEVVAMTGDGVNDAPALRTADMGVAMGITGTDVAKESADLILLDDNFATIVHSVREGRRIYDNIRKFIRQDLTTNVSEVSAILFAFILLIEDPLLTLAPMMILWINLVSDGLPSLALGMDGEEHDVMQRPPRNREEHFFSGGISQKILIRGLVMGAVTYLMFQYAMNHGYSQAYAQTLAFMTLIFGQLVLIFDSRTFSSLYRRNPFGNLWVVGAVLIAASLSLLMVYLPLGNLALGTAPLEPIHLAMILFIAALPTFVLSAIKEMFKLKWL